MNKTRMGKRAASLLLSLVMMLSLLPTAAYAAMADGVDTQGAIVSGNGTDVSDDSNSSGGTGDLQVEDSENSGNTGDQQVGGSSGSGTADDTAGAEGGADTTGAEGGNDSTSVTPSNRVEVNGTVYATLDEAIAAAEPVNGVITYEIYGKVEANSTESWIEVLKAGLTDVTKVAFVGMTNDAEISITNSTSVLADQNYDIDVSFVDLTLSHSNGAWVGDLGHATEYFTCVLRNTDAANNTVTYTNCTFPNGACNNQYGKTVFDTCEFTNTTSGKYNLWNYGGTTEITNSAFTGTRGIKTYNEGTLAESPEVAIKDTTFTGLTEKAAIVASKPTDIKLDSISATECTKGVFQKDIEGSADAEKVTIEANGSGISGNFNVTAEKTAEAAKDEFNITAGSFTAEVPGDYCAEGFTIEKKTDGSYGVKENQPSANVAKVGDTEYATLDKAIAALSGSSYTLELLDESAWDVATPVYWAAGSQSGYAATLADALTAAYKANGDITIVCRPGTDVGKLTHGHVADNITIYGNNAYISSGECDLEVDTYMFSRDTGKQVTTGGAYLDKDITVTAYELDNLGVWGQRHTDHKVTVNLTDCDSVNGITVQRVYISGTTGVNDITLTGCDFGTRATSVYSNADGKVVIDNCSFTGAQVPVNFNHKANGTQAVTVQNSKFTNCGDNGDWKQFAAPVRFVNSGSGTMTTSVDTCTFTGTVGGNGDILLGDGRVGEKSNDVKLTVENTAANVRAQQPGYYAKDGTTDTSKLGTKDVTASDTLTTSVTQLMPSSETTYVAEVKGVKYKSLQAAIDKAGRNATVTLLADTRENVTISTYGLTLDLNGHTLNGGTVAGKPALTVKNRVTVKDSSAAQTGTIMREDTAENSGVSSHYVIDIQDGWLFFESGSVTNNSGVVGVKGASLVRVGDDSVAKYPGLTISGGTFTQDNFIVIKVDRGTFYLKEDGTLNSKNSYAVENWKFAEIKGGTVNGTVAAWTYSGGHNSDLTISGGTVNGNVLSVNYGSAEGKVAKVSITGGTVNGALDTRSYDPSTNELTSIDDATKATIKVTGGTFKEDPSKYVVENSGVTPNGDGTFGVAKAYLAKVGDTSYYTMDEAFKAQTASGEPIVLLRDYTTGSAFSSGSIDRTVDLNGHTWTCTGTDANSAAFEINYSDVTLTVKNGKVVSSQLVGLIPSAMGGTIKYDNSSLEFDGVVMTTTAHSGIETNGNNTNDTVKLVNSELNVPNGFGIYFPSSGTLTIDNSVINAQTMGVQVCAGSLNISGAKTAITVSGDGIPKTINDGAIEDGAAISIVNRTGYKGLDEIKVEGGTFTANGTNAAVKAYDWDNTNKTESDFTQAAKVSVSGGTFSSEVDKSLCAKGYIPTKNADGTYGVKEGKYVAEIGSQGYESLTEAVAAAEDGQTVTLLADAAEDVVISKSITLDLGGKTLTNTNGGKATISVTGGTVTVKNGNVVGGTSYYNIEAKKDANLTLTDVTATAGNTGSSMIDNWGTLTITSGTYTGGLNVVKSEEGSVLNISGGTFTLSYATSGYTGVIFAYGDTTISGGEFIQSLTTTGRWNHPTVILTGVVEGYAAITRVTGGHFVNKMSGESIFRGVGKGTSDNFEVSGGTFNKSIPDGYCADGFIPTKNTDGTYGVKEGQYVAKVGSTKYETLADAIRLAAKGKTITLLADVEQNTQLTINKSITLDLNGKTIRNTVDIWGDKANAILSITNGAKVTITGNGTIDAKENDCYTINVVKGDLTIENGTFYGNVSVVQVEEGTLSVKGGTFDLHQKWEGSSMYLFNCIDEAYVDGSANVAISGGTFVGFDPNVSPEQKVDGKVPSFAAPGVGITKNENGSFTAVDGMTAQILDEDGNSVNAYNTLAEAVAAAQNGQTITLLADVEQNTQLTIGKSITLDLNGKTIKNTVDIWGDTANAILSITNGAKVTITGNGIMDAKANDCYTINVVKGDLTIENGTFYGNVSVVQVQEGTLSVKGGTFDLHQKWEGSSKYLFNCIDSEFTSGNAKVAISGGTFVGFDPNVSPEQKVDGKTPSFAAPGVGITKNENGSFTAVDGMTAQILDKDGNSVNAYNTLAEAVAAAQDGQTVRLLADVALDAQIATGKAITIDGQSKYTIKTVKKLASADGKAGMFYRTQSAKGTLTFLNVTLDGGGVSKIFLNEGGAGETVFDGVTSTNGGGIAYGSGIHISGGGSHATIRNSTLTGSTGTMELNNANYYAANDLWVGGNVYVTVENSVIGNVFVNSAPSATATNGVVHGQLTITGEKTKITYLSGEEEAADKLDKFGNNGSLVKIDSGYVEKVFDKGSYAISGGTFKTEVKKEWCAAGYVPTQNADGTYGVEIGKFTVMVTSRTTGSDSPVANVAGGGSDITYAVGTKVMASAISGYKFVGWFVNEYTGTPYSTDLTCKVKPTDDWTMIAVYEPISGGVFALEVSASKFTVNGGATQRSYLLEKMPVGTQVTVVFKGSENFLYWVNESGKVVSTSKTYTFSMGSATTLKAVYAEKEEHQAMVVFISHTQQVISSKGYTDTQEIQFPEPPIKMGATFVRWSMTEAEIRAAMAATTTGIIVVEPVYEFSAGSYTVTVNYPNDETATYTATVGKITTVTAKSIDGKVFKCWKNGDTVLGYTETLKIAPRGDLTLTAEYVDAGTTVDRLPVIALTEISASQQGAKYAVSFTATRSVPDGYTVTEQGILVSTNSRYGQSDALDAMKLDANGAKPDDTFILKATNTDATGVTVLNGTVSAADRTVYGRAYMILRDSSGAMVYVYSDTILSGSYNSLTTNGGN